MRESVGLACQADHLQHIGHGFLDETLRFADHLKREGDVVEHVLLRQESEILEHHTEVSPEERDLAIAETAEVLPEHVDLPPARVLLLQHESQEAGLAASGSADEKDELTTKDLKRHRVERRSRVPLVELGYLVKPNHVDFEPRQASRG